MPTGSHQLYTWQGTFGPPTAPIEEWQFSLKAAYTPALDESILDAQAEGMRTCWAQNFSGFYKSNIALTRCTSVQIQEGGKYATRADGSYYRGEWTGSVPGQIGATASANMPLQTALTVSLVTARPGPSGKGRFFLPWPHLVLDDGFRLPLANAESTAALCAEFIRDVNLIDRPVRVFSSKGFDSLVTGVRVGRVPDTMRSRRGDAVEGYIGSPV